MNTKQIYSNYLKYNKSGVSFTHSQFKTLLANNNYQCEVCDIRFNAFNGYPVVLGKAHSCVCSQCFEGIMSLNWDVSSLAKAITVVKKIT